MRRLSFALVLVALAGSAALVGAAPAAAGTPCARALINDWYDNGRIDHTYKISCYRQALAELPSDVKEYADAIDVINRALQAQLLVAAHQKSGGGKPPLKGNGTTPQSTTAETTTTPGGTTTSSTTGTTPGTLPPSGPTDTGGTSSAKADDPVITKAIKAIGPNNANSIPLPLVILGVLALILVAAGAAGLVARKLQERRALGDPADSPPTA